MVRSLSSDAALVPRSLAVTPLAVSFLALKRQLWSWDTGTSRGFAHGLYEVADWGGMGFPHPMIYPLAALQIPTAMIFLTVLVVDVALIWAATRLLPRRLSVTATAALWGLWLALSVAAVFLAPVLLGWIWT